MSFADHENFCFGECLGEMGDVVGVVVGDIGAVPISAIRQVKASWKKKINQASIDEGVPRKMKKKRIRATPSMSAIHLLSSERRESLVLTIVDQIKDGMIRAMTKETSLPAPVLRMIVDYAQWDPRLVTFNTWVDVLDCDGANEHLFLPCDATCRRVWRSGRITSPSHLEFPYRCYETEHADVASLLAFFHHQRGFGAYVVVQLILSTKYMPGLCFRKRVHVDPFQGEMAEFGSMHALAKGKPPQPSYPLSP